MPGTELDAALINMTGLSTAGLLPEIGRSHIFGDLSGSEPDNAELVVWTARRLDRIPTQWTLSFAPADHAHAERLLWQACGCLL